MGDTFGDCYNEKIMKCYCRICHEHDQIHNLDSPCNCSGTLKFAHRECIQRWCHQKGDTSCEICLQKYQGGYTTVDKQIVEHVQVSIVRGQSEVAVQRVRSTDSTQHCSLSASNTTDSRCKLVALSVTLVLLVRNLTGTLAGGTLDYPFTLSTLFLLKTTGVLLPMYILFRLLALFRNSMRTQLQVYGSDEEQDEQQLHRLTIYT